MDLRCASERAHQYLRRLVSLHALGWRQREELVEKVDVDVGFAFDGLAEGRPLSVSGSREHLFW